MSDFSSPSPETCAFIGRFFSDAAAYGKFMERMTLLEALLYKANSEFNLTAVKPDSFWSRHVADSISIAGALPEFFTDPGKRKKLCDIGCGAGFPSLVLASAFPFLDIVSVDSTLKKITFVNNAAKELSLENIEGIHARGNELARKKGFNGVFECVTARAVSSLDTLLKESCNFISGSGFLAVYRTVQQAESESRIMRISKKYKFLLTDVFELPDGAGTRLFITAAHK